MPTSCCVANCKNRQKAGCGKTFHRFPFSNESLMNTWILYSRRENWKPNLNSRVCSDHFEANCLDKTGQTVRLREGATPTIFHSLKSFRSGRTICIRPPLQPIPAPFSTCNNGVDINIQTPDVRQLSTDHTYSIQETSPRKLNKKFFYVLDRMNHLQTRLKTSHQEIRRLKKKVGKLSNIIKEMNKH